MYQYALRSPQLTRSQIDVQLDQINQTQLEMDREQKRMAKTMKDQTKGEEMLRQGAARQLSSLKGQVRGTVSGTAH